MGTDTNEIIYDTLVRIEKKCDAQAQQINQIDRRLAVLEANADGATADGTSQDK